MRVSAVLALALVPALAAEGRAQPGAPAAGEPRPVEDDPVEPGQSGPEAEQAGRSRVACLEQDEEGGQRKGVQKRDFLKRRRFEVSGLGGLYASDVLSSTYMAGGTVAFFPSEDFGVEALVTYMPVQFRLEEPFFAFDGRSRFVPGSAIQAVGALLFSPIHAKFKVTEQTIVHGDVFLLAGAGRTFHESVQGLTWQAGVGLKLYLGRFVSFRLDVRNFVLPQEVLGRGRVTFNLGVLGGFGIWLG